MTSPAEDALLFLKLLYGDCEDGFWLNLWRTAKPHDRWFHSDALQDMASAAVTMADHHDVWFGVGLKQDRPPDGRRGCADDVAGIPGLWLDIDIKGPAHAQSDLPGNEDAALALLEELPLKPTLLVRSGNGLQAWWLLKEIWIFRDKDDHARAARLSSAWEQLAHKLAANKKWKLDTTADLARILRLPGTRNHKLVVKKIETEPRSVSLFRHDGPRYDPSDIEEILQQLASEGDPNGGQSQGSDSPQDQPGADQATEDEKTEVLPDLTRIERGCAFMRHCHDDAAKLPEPEWYAWVGTAARCENGRDLVHEISSVHPGYTVAETEKKIAHAMLAAKPRTCKNIHEKLGFEGCIECPMLGRIKSPIALGYEPKQTEKRRAFSGFKYQTHAGTIGVDNDGNHSALCNFDARIVKKLEVRDGEEDRAAPEGATKYVIKGRLQSGKPLRAIEVAAVDFENVIRWIEPPWGPDAMVYPGKNHEWHLANGIKALSENGYALEVRHINTGFIVDDQHGELFLAANGAINSKAEFTTEVCTTAETAEIAQFQLRSPSKTAEERRRVAEQTLNLAKLPLKLRLQALAMAAMVRPVLGNCDYAIFLVGSTGTLKTSLASYVQQAYAPASGYDNTPLNFENSVKANLRLTHRLKDTLVVIDDYRATRPGHLEHAEALLQAIGNRAPRRGLTRSGDMRAGMDRPRCLVWITGEDRIVAESAAARCLEIAVSTGEIPSLETGWPQARDREGRDGTRNQFLSDFIGWLMKYGYRSAQQYLQEQRRKHASRLAYHHRGVHGRTVSMVADLSAALDLFGLYCEELKLVVPPQEWTGVLEEEIAKQTRLQRDNNPIERVREILRDGIAASRLFVAPNVPSRDGGRRDHLSEIVSPSCRCIGDINHDRTLIGLIASEVLAVVRETEGKLGRPFTMSSRRFHEMLIERKWMAKPEGEGRLGRPFRVAGQKTYRAVVPSAFLFDEEAWTEEDDAKDFTEDPASQQEAEA